MQIRFGTVFLAGPEATAAPVGLTIQGAQDLQERKPLGADARKIISRKQWGVTIAWTVIRQHATVAACQLYLADHLAAIIAATATTVTLNFGGRGVGGARVLNNAAVKVADMRQVGIRSIVSYTAIGGTFA